MVDYTYVLFHCPVCGNVLKTPEMYIGEQGFCPFCENAISVSEDEVKQIVPEIMNK